jgi:hypothetical protein
MERNPQKVADNLYMRISAGGEKDEVLFANHYVFWLSPPIVQPLQQWLRPLKPTAISPSFLKSAYNCKRLLGKGF